MNTLFKLYFGRNVTNSDPVSDSAVNMFLAEVVSFYFEGFTVSHNLGYWEGEPEPSFCVEVLADVSDIGKVNAIAKRYASQFRQNCVLVTAQTVTAEFVTIPDLHLRFCDEKHGGNVSECNSNLPTAVGMAKPDSQVFMTGGKI